MSGPIRVLVLRPEPQAGRMAAELATHGLEVVIAPMLSIKIEPGAIARILDPNLPTPDVIVFTSAQGVAAIEAAEQLPALIGLPVYAVGGTTAEAARAAGFADVSVADGDGSALVRKLDADLPPDTVIVHVAGRERSLDIAEAMKERGRVARTVVAYGAEALDRLNTDVAEDLAAGRFDIAVLASRRTAETFRRALGRTGLALPSPRPALVAISAAAADPLRGVLTRIFISESPDGAGLTFGVVALAAALAKNRGEHRP